MRGQSVPHQHHRLAGVERSDLLQDLDQRDGPELPKLRARVRFSSPAPRRRLKSAPWALFGVQSNSTVHSAPSRTISAPGDRSSTRLPTSCHRSLGCAPMSCPPAAPPGPPRAGGARSGQQLNPSQGLVGAGSGEFAERQTEPPAVVLPPDQRATARGVRPQQFRLQLGHLHLASARQRRGVRVALGLRLTRPRPQPIAAAVAVEDSAPRRPARVAGPGGVEVSGDAFEIGGVKEGVGPQSAGLPMRRAIPAECRSAAAGRHRADERTYPRVDSRAAPDPAAVRGAHSLLLRPFSSVPAPVEQDSGAARQANPGRMGVRGAARAQAPCVVAP